MSILFWCIIGLALVVVICGCIGLYQFYRHLKIDLDEIL